MDNKVYVLETGMYDSQAIFGVFSTPELAMAAWNPLARQEPPPAIGQPNRPHSYLWQQEGDRWHFDADWGDYAVICAYEVNPEAKSRRGKA